MTRFCLQSDEFFKLSREKKDALAWDSPASNRGYVSQGREKVSQLTKEEVESLRDATPYANTSTLNGTLFHSYSVF